MSTSHERNQQRDRLRATEAMLRDVLRGVADTRKHVTQPEQAKAYLNGALARLSDVLRIAQEIYGELDRELVDQRD